MIMPKTHYNIITMVGLFTLAILSDLTAANLQDSLEGKRPDYNSGPNIPEDCIIPERDSFIPGRNFSCYDVSNERLYECFHQDVASTCCHICPTMVYDNRTYCKYEDRNKECSAISKSACHEMGKICCQTCKKYFDEDNPNPPFENSTNSLIPQDPLLLGCLIIINMMQRFW